MIKKFLKKILLGEADYSMDLVRYLPLSERTGRVFAVGDIHGERDIITKALHALNFDFDRDRLLCLGDIFDRGKNPEECLDLLSKPWIDSALGNHEFMFLNTVAPDGSLVVDGNPLFDTWMSSGGDWALKAQKIKLAQWRALLLEKVAINWLVERKDGHRALICHAEPDSKELDDIFALKNRPIQPQSLLNSPALWGCSIIPTIHDKSTSSLQKQKLPWIEGVLFSVHGHTQVKTAGWVNNLLFADTGAVFGNKLTLIDLDLVIPGRSNGIYSMDMATKRLVSYAGTTFHIDPKFASRFSALDKR